MEICLSLFSILKSYMPDNAQHYPISQDATVMDIIEELGIPGEFREGLIIVVNGIVRRDYASGLQHHDDVKIFLAAYGG